MELAPVNVELSFEVTFDRADLDVGMCVYDDSGVDPVLVQGPSAMGLVAGYTYRGKFTADAEKSYIIIKAVYTDDTFTTLDSDYSQGSESIVVQDLATGGGGGGGADCSVVGLVDEIENVIGIVDC